MQLIPSRNFTVVRQIGNHTDVATYYCRAVIRDAYTDVILDTLDLTDKGSQRFKKDWLVPVESSGLGKFISIVTSVYIDSGYATKSSDYADEENTYLWAELKQNTGGGGGALQSEKFNYTRIKKIVQDAVDAIPAPKIPSFPEIPKPKEYEMRWDEVLASVNSLKAQIASIPPPPPVDFNPVMQGLQAVHSAIKEKEVTPATDVTPILDTAAQMKSVHEAALSELKTLMEEVVKSVEEITRVSDVTDAVAAKVQELFNQTKFVASMPTAKKEAETEDDDYNGIANSLTS